MQGKSSTTPKGMEMLELPFNRKGRLKNANLELVFALDLTSSMEGRFGDEGIRFSTLCTKPIVTNVLADSLGNVRYRRQEAHPHPQL